ncbi:MAG: hypothetical protein ACYC26_10295 [Phycisphaerales bacterium]
MLTGSDELVMLCPLKVESDIADLVKNPGWEQRITPEWLFWRLQSRKRIIDLTRREDDGLFKHVDMYVPWPPHSGLCLFQTQDGASGILQVMAHTDNPRGIKIRYRLVETAVEQMKTAEQEYQRLVKQTEDGRAGSSELTQAKAKWLEAQLQVQQMQDDSAGALKTAEELVKVAEVEHQWMERLAQAGRVSQADADQAKSSWLEAQLRVQQMKGDLEAAMKVAEELVEIAEAKYQWAERLMQAGRASRHDVDAAKAKWLEAQLRVRQMQADTSNEK